MRTPTAALLAALALAATAGADDTATKVAAQKKAAAAAWEEVEAGPAVSLETKHLLIYAPKAMDKKLKAVGTALEKYHDLAAKALALDPKKAAYPGKVIVYLFGERDHFTALVRRVEKRRLEAGQTSSHAADDDKLHAAAYAAKGAPAVEAQAGEQLAALLLARKAGVTPPLPDWLLAGFGRATHYRTAPRDKAVLDERRLASRLSAKRRAPDAWGGSLEAGEVAAMQGSVADFLAYGPGAKQFAAFVEGFKPGEDMRAKATEQALEAAKLKLDAVEKTWKAWAVSPK